MGKKYGLNSDDQDFLKVAKLNQDISEKALKTAREASAAFRSEIEQNEAFLAAIESKLGITGTVASVSSGTHVHHPGEERSYDELVAEANAEYPDLVSFEDLLSEEEFANALRRADHLYSQLSYPQVFEETEFVIIENQ